MKLLLLKAFVVLTVILVLAVRLYQVVSADLLSKGL